MGKIGTVVLRYFRGKSDWWLLMNTFLIFEVFFQSYIGRHLHLKYVYSLCWSYKLKFKIWDQTSDCCDIPFSKFEVFFHYIIGCRFHLQHFSLVWSYKLKFKIWGRSDQWLLIFYIFNISGLLPLFYCRLSLSEILL